MHPVIEQLEENMRAFGGSSSGRLDDVQHYQPVPYRQKLRAKALV